MEHHYVILPRMHVVGANAQPTPWLIAPPSMTAYQGFAHALAREIGAGTHAGFAVVHHDIEHLGEVAGGVLHPLQLRGAQLIDHADFASATPHILSSQPAARCRLNVSMIVRFDSSLALAEHKIERFLHSARVAGGAIISHQFSPRDASLIRGSTPFTSDIAARIGTGFAVHDRSDLMQMREGDRDQIDPFLRAVTRPFPDAAHIDKLPDARRWIVPTAVGYATVSSLADRGQVRQGLKHAFAEAMVGLVEYRPLRQTPPPFWVPEWPAPNVFVVSARDVRTV